MPERCDAEMCPRWTGHGCVCTVLGLDPAGASVHGRYELTVRTSDPASPAEIQAAFQRVRTFLEVREQTGSPGSRRVILRLNECDLLTADLRLLLNVVWPGVSCG